MNLYVQRCGRLGNHLFQWAFAKALAIDLDAALFCDTKCDSDQNTERLIFQFPTLNFPVQTAPVGAYLVRLIEKYTPEVYDNLLESLRRESPENVLIFGNPQGWHHIDMHSAAMREALRIERQAEYEDCIGVGVRRGDFLRVGFYLDLPVAWFVTAVDHLRQRLDRPIRKVVVFSDDAAWCQAELLLPLAARFGACTVDASDPWGDFARLRSCAGLVVTNSTFLWWAAWLANVPTICPVLAVFNHPEHYYPPRWTRLHQTLLTPPNSTVVRLATYGAVNGKIEIAGILNQIIDCGGVEVCACNELAGDPCPGTRKILRIEFADGRKVSVDEGALVRLCDMS